MANLHAIPMTLSGAKQNALLYWKRSHAAIGGLALRGPIFLTCAEMGVADISVNQRLPISNFFAGKGLRRFAEHGIDCPIDVLHSIAPQSIRGEQAREVVVKTLQTTQKKATIQRSKRQLPAYLDQSQTAMHRVGHEYALARHRSRAIILSTCRPVTQMAHDNVILYSHVFQRVMLFCVDKKPSIQVRQEAVPFLHELPKWVETHSHDYIPFCTTEFYAAFDVLTDKVLGDVHRSHRSIKLHYLLNTIEWSIHRQFDSQLHVTHSTTYKILLARRWLIENLHVHLHFTLTSRSWLDFAECWLVILMARQFVRGEFTSPRLPENTIRTNIKENDANSESLVWYKAAYESLHPVPVFCQRTSNSYH